MKIPRRTFTLSLLASGLNSACSTLLMPELMFDPSIRYQTRTITVAGRALLVRTYENVPTVQHPQERDYQALNLYIPAAYFEGGSVGDYDARSAPIFLPNAVGGYMPARPAALDARMGPPPAAGQPRGPNAIEMALSRGFVVAAPGARGRTLRTADGRWTGKAPAAIVDLKAAVRWLRYNADRLPGNTERIIANGTSAGGALAALLGSSGNSADYDAELQACGAAPRRDDVFAVSAYCPITNLAHADAAYEWQFHGLETYRHVAISMLDFRVQRQERTGQLTPQDQALSTELRAAFARYVNALGLHAPDGPVLQLDAQGQGSLREHVRALVMASAQQALAQGQDVQRPWLRVANGRVLDLDFDAYVRAAGRMKALPAFDGLALETGENQLFGDEHTDTRHFTAFAQQHSRVPDAQQADARTVQQMNAMHYARQSDTAAAPHWRIRHGTMDRDTSLAIPVLLAAALRERGLKVDLALPWDRPHSGDYDLEALFDWMEQCVRAA
jgi:alpha/beta hydrolase fold